MQHEKNNQCSNAFQLGWMGDIAHVKAHFN